MTKLTVTFHKFAYAHKEWVIRALFKLQEELKQLSAQT